MGFGTLFIGYFFILNFPYCEFTDAISGALMLYALYKLSGINDYFRFAGIFSAVFTLFGIFELGCELYAMFFSLPPESLIFSVSALVRYVIIGLATVFMMLGIYDVANEVGLSSLAEKSRRGAYVSLAVYVFSLILESASLTSFIPAKFLVVAYVFAILATLTVNVFNLTCIYSSYMRICMPEDKEVVDRESKIGFINSFKKHEEEKSREYAEYKLSKLKEKKEKKNKGNRK